MKELDNLLRDKIEEMIELEAGSDEAKTASEVVKNLALAQKELEQVRQGRDTLNETVRSNIEHERLESERDNANAKLEKKQHHWNVVKIISAIVMPVVGLIVGLISKKKLAVMTMGYEASGSLRSIASKDARDDLEKEIKKFENLRGLED